MDICPLCGHKVVRTSKNVTIVDGFIVHKKCPKGKGSLSDQDKADYKELMATIKKLCIERPQGVYKEGLELNMRVVACKIKELINKGYTYKDIIYAQNVIVEKQDGFWGFGAVVNNIDSIIAKRDKKEERKTTLKKHTSEQIHVDLSKMLESEDEW